MSGNQPEERALVDTVVLRRLSDEVHGSPEIAQHFVRDFISTWNCRIERLRAACIAADLEDAYVVLLSIRTTSEMLGALALADAALRAQIEVKAGRMDACALGALELSAIGERTIIALEPFA